MTGYEILVDAVKGNPYVAIMANGKVDNLYIDMPDNPAPRWGSVYFGRVTRIDERLNAAFVQIGDKQEGFLPAKHAITDKPHGTGIHKRIGECVEPGQMILVQVKAEGIYKTVFEHEKLPRLTMKLIIPGRTLFYSPVFHKVIRSPKLRIEDVRDLQPVLLRMGGGWIIRAAMGRESQTQILQEAEYLRDLWRKVHHKIVDYSGPDPVFLLGGPDAVRRALIDYSNRDIQRIEIARDKDLESADKWCGLHAAALQDKIIKYTKSPKDRKMSLFDFRDVSGTLDELEHIAVEMPDGGSIIIEHTHAMTVADVNFGSGKSLLDINADAAKEIARQIRLRNISGAVIIDFINMQTKTDRYYLIETLQTAMADDPANPDIFGFTRLWNMELTRTRRTATLRELMGHSYTLREEFEFGMTSKFG